MKTSWVTHVGKRIKIPPSVSLSWMAFLPACHNGLFSVPCKATSPSCMSSDGFVYLFIFFGSFYVPEMFAFFFLSFLTRFLFYHLAHLAVCPQARRFVWGWNTCVIDSHLVRLLGVYLLNVSLWSELKSSGEIGSRKEEKKCLDMCNDHIRHALDISLHSLPREKMWNAHSRPATPAMTVGPFDLSCNRLRYLLLWQEI